MRISHKILSLLLATVLSISSIGAIAYATDGEADTTPAAISGTNSLDPASPTEVTDNLCAHHLAHDATCVPDGSTNCSYVCAICPVQTLIDALPTVEAIQAMDETARLDAYNQVQAAYDAYAALTDEQKAQLPNAEQTFETLFNYFNGLVAPANTATSGTCGTNLTWTYDDTTCTLTISGSGDMTDYFEEFAPWHGYCSSITSVSLPDGISSIGDGAFRDCGNLTSITLPNGVASIGRHAFRDCGNLTTITIPNSVTDIDSWAFRNCRSLSNITIPNNVISIGTEAFAGCESLTNVTIPSSAGAVAPYSFSGCTSLANITIQNGITRIGDYAFSDCVALTNIILPNSITSIGFRAFGDCSGLKNITISNRVTEIETAAFANCSNLTEVTIPNSVTSIGDGAFDNCDRLTAIVVDTQNSTYSSESGCLFDKNKNTLIRYPEGKLGATYTILDSVTSIGDSAFYSCNNLTSIKIPGEVGIIPTSAFHGCTALTDVTIYDGVIKIEDGAFYNCTNLEYVIIPSSVTDIGDEVFYGCNTVTDIYYAGSENDWANVAGIDNLGIDLTKVNIHYNSTGPGTGTSSTFDFTLSQSAEHIETNGTFILTITPNGPLPEGGSFSIISRDPSIATVELADPSVTGFSGPTDLLVTGKSEGITFIQVSLSDDMVQSCVVKVSDQIETGYKTHTGVVTGHDMPTSTVFVDGNEYFVDSDEYTPNAELLGKRVFFLTKDEDVVHMDSMDQFASLQVSAETTGANISYLKGKLSHTDVDVKITVSYKADQCPLREGYDRNVILADEYLSRPIVLDGLQWKLNDNIQLKNAGTSSAQGSLPLGGSWTTTAKVALNASYVPQSNSNDLKNYVTVTANGGEISRESEFNISVSKISVYSEMTVEMTYPEIYYKKDGLSGKLSSDGDSYSSYTDFQIPFTVTVENTTSRLGLTEQMRMDRAITISELAIDPPDGFNTGWTGDGKIDLGDNYIIFPGEKQSWSGFIRAGTWYKPEAATNEYTVKVTAVADQGGNSASATFKVIDTETSGEIGTTTWEKGFLAEFYKAKDINETINPGAYQLSNYFDEDTLSDITRVVAVWQATLKSELVQNQSGRPKPALKIVCNMNEDNGEHSATLIFYDKGIYTSSYANFSTIEYAMKDNDSSRVIKGTWSATAKTSASNFANGVKEYLSENYETEAKAFFEKLAKETIKDVINLKGSDYLKYMLQIANDFEKYGGYIGQAKSVLSNPITASESSVAEFNRIAAEAKKTNIKCPVDVFVYNSNDALCGKIENEAITLDTLETFMHVENGEKTIWLTGNDYRIEIIATGNGTMDYEVEEYLQGELSRTVRFTDVPLFVGIKYDGSIPAPLDIPANDYKLTSNFGDVIYPDGNTNGGNNSYWDQDDDISISTTGSSSNKDNDDRRRNAVNQSAGGSSVTFSNQDSEKDFWNLVVEKIKNAQEYSTIRANARDLTHMPVNIMEALRQRDDVTLIIERNAGENIVIPAGQALDPGSRTSDYALSELADMEFAIMQEELYTTESTVPAAESNRNANPATGR